MAQDWDIKPRSDSCSTCDRQFADGEKYQSALFFDDEGYWRGDYCEACWAEHEGETPLSTWEGVFRLPPPPPEEPLKKETAESLLRKLMEEDEPRAGVIYILAVMLERKKILSEKDVQTDDEGEMVRIYAHRKTGETFVIPDPRLRLDELDHVQAEVVGMLGEKKKAPPAEEPTEPTPDTSSEQPPDLKPRDGFYTKG